MPRRARRLRRGPAVFPCAGREQSADGEWFPAETATSGMGGTRKFQTNGTVIQTYGAALHYKYQLETNGVTNTVLMPGPKGPAGPPVRMDFTITNDTLTLQERRGQQRERLTRVEGTSGEGLFGQWTGKHYTGGRQVIEFTTNLYGYLSVPFMSETGSFTLDGNRLTEELRGQRTISEWTIANDVLTLTPPGGQPEKYRRKGAALPGDEIEFSDEPDLETEKIEALLKHLGSLKDANFIRNDQAYEPEEAAAMMRGKWLRQEADIDTATEFIEKIMTASSSDTKKPYLIRFQDGTETPCADYLWAELKKLDSTPSVGAKSATKRLPRGLWIKSAGENYVHADISDVSIEDYPALTNLHALFAVYFEDDGATDEKLEALTNLRFTNLTCIYLLDCRLLTDKGIDYVSRIPSVINLALSGMAINDATCHMIAARIRLHDVSIGDCPNVTVNGLLAIVQSKTINSLRFSMGDLKQEDLIQLISQSAPQLTRMDIEMDDSSVRRLDLPALRQAVKVRKIKVYACRNGKTQEL
jgi:hypothetical protein